MIVISKNGLKQEYGRIIAVVEKNIAFNGMVRRICEAARDIREANAISFEHEDVFRDNNLYVGNLKNDKVLEMLRSDVIDLTSMDFQKAKTLDEVVLDDGVSLAYSNEITPFFTPSYYAGISPFSNNYVSTGVNSAFGIPAEFYEDEEGDEEEYCNFDEAEEE